MAVVSFSIATSVQQKRRMEEEDSVESIMVVTTIIIESKRTGYQDSSLPSIYNEQDELQWHKNEQVKFAII
jgi:hypothetical protein